MMPVGLLIYGWAVEKRVFGLVPDIGTGIFSRGVVLSSQSLFIYLIVEFTIFAASSNAALRILINLAGFAFPLFSPQLFRALGHGWGNSLLALVSVMLNIPAIFVLWTWGPKIRAIGRATTV